MSCLCRTLLAFVAVSCTLSRTHAHGQATQRLDQIKDLMCVFLLSGMQKEDLDVNMLTKLQRHNVNIGDMSNRELLQKCTRIKRNESIQNNSLQTTTESVKDNFTKGDKIEMTSNKIDNKNATNDKTIPKDKTATNDKNTTNDKIATNDKTITNDKNTTNDKTITNDKKENVTKSVIDYVGGQPDIQSVLNFWQNVKVNKSNITMHFKKSGQLTDTSQKKSEQKNKRNIQYNPNVQETEIKKLITNYFLRDNTVSTTTVKTNIIKENGLRDLSFKQTYNNNNQRLIENNIVSDNTNNFNSLLRLFDQYSKTRQKSEEESTTTPRITTKAYKNNTNINDLLNFLNIYKTYYPDVANGKNKESFNSAPELNVKRDFVTDKPFTVSNNIINDNIPQNFIKEIAISVKDMVLKELRKEIKSPTIGYTTVGSLTTYDTTEKAIPTISHNIDEAIMNKFLDLFKEIKSLKQSSIVISNKNKPGSEMVRLELKNDNASLKKTRGEEYDMEPTVQIYNNVESKKPILYNFSPQVHKLRTFSKPKPIQISKPRRLITIQTNNMEIPPLGIPIDMPENPINQNIVVTTAQYRISRNKANLRNVKVEQGLVFDDYVPKEKYVAKPIIDAYNSNINPNYQVMLPLSLKKNDRTNVERHHKKNYPERYTQSDMALIAKAPIARYHEKLENGDIFLDVAPQKQQNIMDQIDCCNEKYTFSQQMIECCNSRIAARQQMSLSKVKKQSLYDAHYNNFVKSQKKVNDMLEKILASKNSNRIQAPGVQIA